MYVPNPQTIEPEFTIEVDSFTQTIFAPTNSTFAFVKGTRHAQHQVPVGLFPSIQNFSYPKAAIPFNFGVLTAG